MQRTVNIHRWLLAAWIMLCGCGVGSAYAGQQHRSYVPNGSVVAPSYQFQTTSTYFSNPNQSNAYVQAIQTASQTNTKAYNPSQAFTVKLSNATVTSYYAAGPNSGGGVSYGGSSGSGNNRGGINYSFRSTSIYTLPVGSTVAATLTDGSENAVKPKGILRRSSNPWDKEPEDDPIGVVPTVPIGEPLILLLFAMAYLLGKMGWKRLQTKLTYKQQD